MNHYNYVGILLRIVSLFVKIIMSILVSIKMSGFYCYDVFTDIYYYYLLLGLVLLVGLGVIVVLVGLGLGILVLLGLVGLGVLVGHIPT